MFNYCVKLLLLGFAIAFAYPTSAAAFYTSKDAEAIHARFDLIESKVDSLKNLHDTALRNQADMKVDTVALRDEFTRMSGLLEDSNRKISQLLENLNVLLEEKFKKIAEFNQAFFEQDKKNKEIFQENFRLELENIASKIADLATIYKTSAQENIERDNNREQSLVSNFNTQLEGVNSKISQLIEIYKQSISAVTTSGKSNLEGVDKQLVSVNSNIKLLTEIYKTSIKENNAAITTMGKNLSKELQSINDKLSKPKPSTAKK